MPAFVFNTAPTDFSTGEYYVLPVETTPSPGSTIRSQLVVPPGFPSHFLTGRVLTPGVRVTFADTTVPSFAYGNSTVGLVILRQVFVSDSSTDALVSFTPFTNSLGQEFAAPPGVFAIPIAFGVDGAIKLLDVFLYSSSGYISGANPPVPFGLFYLWGTKNNTQNYVNPVAAKNFLCVQGSATGATAELTNRVVATGNSTGNKVFDFGINRVRVGVVGIYNTPGSTAPTEVFGSNSFADITNDSVTLDTGWVSLGTNGSGGSGAWTLITSLDQVTYWRFLKLKNISGVAEAELYNSTAMTPYEDCLNPDGDPNFAFVEMQSNFEAPNGTTVVVNEAYAKNGTFTLGGGSSVVTTQARFGNSSLFLPGSGPGLQGVNLASVPVISANQDFTFAAWVRFSNNNNGGIWCATGSHNTGLHLFGGWLRFTVAGTIQISGTVVPDLDTWHYVGCKRTAGVITMWLNGTQEGPGFTYTSAIPPSIVGTFATANGGGMSGHMDSFKFVYGVAEDLSVVPTIPFATYGA